MFIRRPTHLCKWVQQGIQRTALTRQRLFYWTQFLSHSQ